MRLYYCRHIRLFAALLLALLLIPATGWPQSNIKLSGTVVDDETGVSIVGVNLLLDGTGYKTATDNRGHFEFVTIPVGTYNLTVSSIGYKSEQIDNIEIEPDITKNITIKLERETYYLGQIKVKADPIFESPDNVVVVFRAQIEKSRAQSTSDILEEIPGVYVQKSGTSGGQAKVRIRGADPKHVLVLLDGHKMNQSGDGTADLNSIPLEMVERIEVHKGGGSSQYGADALGGVINIVTQKSIIGDNITVRAQNCWGRWESYSSSFALDDLRFGKNVSMKLSYGHKSLTGNYPFEYKTGIRDVSIEGTRLNNKLRSDNYFLSGLYNLSQKIDLSYSGQVYDARQGLPGRADRQDSLSYMDDQRYNFSSTLKYALSKRYMTSLEIGYSRFVQEFYGQEARLPFHSKYDNEIITIRQTNRMVPLSNNQLLIGTEFRRDFLDHEDKQIPRLSMKETLRDNYSFYFNDRQTVMLNNFLPVDQVSLSGSIRFDYARTIKDSTSYKDESNGNRTYCTSPGIGIAIRKGKDINYQIRADYGKSFRLPSLNAIFWKSDIRSDGNPGLKPERSEHSEIGLTVNAIFSKVDISVGTSYYHSNINDLIVWIPVYNSWQPINNDRAIIYGREDMIRLSLFDNLLVFQYGNSLTMARNKTDEHTIFNKLIPFYPGYVTTVSFAFEYKMLNLSYSYRMVGKAYINRSNTDYYPGYEINDLAIGLNFRLFSKLKMTADYQLSNFNDDNYLLMSNFPMPGREWSTGIKITYGGNN